MDKNDKTGNPGLLRLRLTRRWAPEQIISAATVAALVFAVAAIWLATQCPSLGLVLAAGPNGVIIEHAHASGPAAALAPGARLVSLRSGTQTIPLYTADFTPEPDVGFNRITEYRAFLARQHQLARALAEPKVTLLTGGGHMFSIAPRGHRPIHELPWPFWLQLLCGVLGLVTGAAVFAYRQHDPAAGYYALTGAGLAAAAISAAVYSTRELALELPTFELLRSANQSGTLIYTAGFVAVLWHYPRRLGRFPLGPTVLAIYATLTVSALCYWLPTIDLNMRLPVLAGFCVAIALGVAQWRRSRGEPLDRAGLRWFLLSWFSGSSLFLALVFVPPLLGIDSAAAQAPAFVLLLVIHLGLAVGILRYRLFRLDRWWAHTWVAAFSLIAIFALNLLLIHATGLAGPVTLGLTLAVIGWLYLPLQRALLRWSSGQKGLARPALVRMTTTALSHPEHDAEQAWLALLREVYRPRELVSPVRVAVDSIGEGGLALDVAEDSAGTSARLRYCRDGGRLFRPGDLDMLADLRALFAEILNYRSRLHEAISAERDRVSRDLHDDVGARLLTLSHSLKGRGADQARQALADLRAVVYSMRAAATTMAELLGDWRAEAAERCDAAGIDLDWHVNGCAPAVALTGGAALTLSRIFRETLSNALRHGSRDPAGHRIELHLKFTNTRLDVCISNDYSGPSPDEWRESLGLHNLRERVTRLGGDIRWVVERQRLGCHWNVDVALTAGQDE